MIDWTTLNIQTPNNKTSVNVIKLHLASNVLNDLTQLVKLESYRLEMFILVLKRNKLISVYFASF